MCGITGKVWQRWWVPCPRLLGRADGRLQWFVVNVVPNLVYAERAGSPLRFDLFLPDRADGVPLVIFIHGGGWISGEKESYHEEAAWLAPQGVACACIEYRLAPLFPFPAAVADVQDFVTFARQNAESWGASPSRIISIGNSAGGHLALMAGYCRSHLATGEPFQGVDGVVNICGISDLRIPEDSHFGIANSFLEQFMDGPHAGNEVRWEAASPMVHASPESPRTLSIHGDQDDVVPVDLSRNLHLALKDMGVDSQYVELPGEGHAFSLDAWLKIRDHFRDFAGVGR